MNRINFLTLAICTLVGYVLCTPTGETDCQRRRRNEQSATGNLSGLLVPECDEHGNYKPIQCFGETIRGRRFCACYDKEFGQIKGPSRSLRSCNCVVAYHEWEHTPASERGSEPHCNATSGEYNPVQCNTTDHWCVETDSGRLLGAKMHGGCSTDLSNISCGIDGTHHGHHGSHGQSPHGSHSDSHHGTHADPHTDASHQSSSHDGHSS